MKAITVRLTDARYRELQDIIRAVYGRACPGCGPADVAEAALHDWMGVLKRKAIQKAIQKGNRLEAEAAAAAQPARNVIDFPHPMRAARS